MNEKSVFRSALVGSGFAVALLFAPVGGAWAINCDLGTTAAGDTCTINTNQTVNDAVTDVDGSLLVTDDAVLTFSHATPTLNVGGNLTVNVGSTISAAGVGNNSGRDLLIVLNGDDGSVAGDAVVSGTITTQGGVAGGEAVVNGGALTMQVFNDLTVAGVITTQGGSVAANSNDSARNGGDMHIEVGGDMTATGLLSTDGGSVTGNANDSSRNGGDMHIEVGGELIATGTLTSKGGSVTGNANDSSSTAGEMVAQVVESIDVENSGLFTSSGGSIGSNGPRGDAAPLSLRACIDITVADENGSFARFLAMSGAGGNSGGNGDDIALNAGGDITLGSGATFNVSGPVSSGETIIRHGGVFTDNGAVFTPPNSEDIAQADLADQPVLVAYCPVAAADNFAKVSGVINRGDGPAGGNDPTHAFDGQVANDPDPIGTIEINYRLEGPSLCTFTPTSIVYDVDNFNGFTDLQTAEIEASYECVGGAEFAGDATIMLWDRGDNHPSEFRGAISVVADDNELNIEAIALETGNAHVDSGL
ncbi:MAG TPA: hypothetical protein VGC25_08255 [Alphaproteobacteria bacterium]